MPRQRFARLETASSQRVALEKVAGLIRKGSIHPEILKAAKAVTRDCDARDDLCELEAVYQAVKVGSDRVPWLRRGVRYLADPYSFDAFHAVTSQIRLCEEGSCAFDCLPLDTLVLRHDYRIVPLDDVRVGDAIWGDGRWTTITARQDKGVKPLLAIELNNGSVLRVTGDHRVFRVPKVNENGNRTPSATLSGPRETAEEIRAGEVRVGDDLLTADRIDLGVEEIDLDRAWLLGVYIADGWVGYSEMDGRPISASISGKDGHPKEAQKRRVQEIADRFGWESRWGDRAIRINDEGVAVWLASTGRRAPQKHVPSGLNYNEATIRAILSGLCADAFVRSDGTITHGTTSPLLAAQLRVMYRMMGVSTSVRRVDRHGGLGSNPIYRITPRRNDRPDGKKAKAHARVKGIASIDSTPVMDIATDTGRFYLPETDLVVHNCDDQTILVGSLAAALGFKVGARAWGPDTDQDGDYQHVYAVAAVPKGGPWPKDYYGHALDTTVPSAAVGWEPSGGHILTAWLHEG